MDDVRLRLDDGSVIRLDATAVNGNIGLIDLGPRGRLVVDIGGPELWPDENASDPATVEPFALRPAATR